MSLLVERYSGCLHVTAVCNRCRNEGEGEGEGESEGSKSPALLSLSSRSTLAMQRPYCKLSGHDEGGKHSESG